MTGPLIAAAQAADLGSGATNNGTDKPIIPDFDPVSHSNLDPTAALVLRHLLDGRPVNGHLDRLPPDLIDLAEAMIAAPPPERDRAFTTALATLDPSAAAAIRAAVFAADPLAELGDLAPSGDPAINKLIWARDALEPQPPIAWVIENLFSVGSVNIMFGPPGTKKTWALLDAAFCVANGADWLGMAAYQAPALIVDEESGPTRLKRRLGAVLRGHFADDPDLPLAAASLNGFDLRNDEQAATLKKIILATGAQLVIIDALADVMPGGDENTVKDVQPLMIRLRRIAYDTDSAIVVIHHSNKAGDYRGSTALPGAVDCMVQVSSNAGSPYIDLEVVKSRDGEPFKFSAQCHWSEDQFWLTAAETRQTVRKLPKAQAYVLRYMAETGGAAPIKEIMAHPDTCNENSARQAVYGLAAEGYLRRTDTGGQGTAATYGFTDKTQELLDVLGVNINYDNLSENTAESGKL